MKIARARGIERCFIQALKRANAEYEKISGEWITERGVESFLGRFVARSFNRQEQRREFGWLVRPEVTIAEFENNYANRINSPIGRRSKYRKKRNRLDLVFLKKIAPGKFEARAIVELKRNVDVDWRNDIRRVAHMVGKYGSSGCLQWGAFLGVAPEEKADCWISKSKAWPKYIDYIDGCAEKEKVGRHIINPQELPFKIADNEWRMEVVGVIFYPKAREPA